MRVFWKHNKFIWTILRNCTNLDLVHVRLYTPENSIYEKISAFRNNLLFVLIGFLDQSEEVAVVEQDEKVTRCQLPMLLFL